MCHDFDQDSDFGFDQEFNLDDGVLGTLVLEELAEAPISSGHLPQWQVLLHNDDLSTYEQVIGAIVELTPLDRYEAFDRTHEADREGISLLLVTSREHAELLQEQFTSKSLSVTIEPDRG